jgi:hypothetical protein
MLFVHARTSSIVPWLRASSLAVVLAVGLAFLTTGPGRGEETPAYAIEVSDITAKVGERACEFVTATAFFNPTTIA